MKKNLVSLFTLLLVIFSGCSSGDSSDGDSYKIRIPLLGSESNFVNKSYEEFKENVEKESDGQIEVEIYASGTMASSEEQQFDLVTDGGAEVSSVASGIIANHAGIDKYGIFDVPFLFNTDDKIEQFLDSDLVTEPHEDLEDKKNV